MTHFRSPLEVSDFLMKKTNKTYLGNLLIKSHFLFNHEKVYQIFEKKNRIVNQEVATIKCSQQPLIVIPTINLIII